MSGGTPATHLKGPVIHTDGMASAKSLGSTFSAWPNLPIGFESSTFYWWRNFNFACGADVPGATAVIGGAVSATNMVSNLNPWTVTEVNAAAYDINTATFPSSLKVATNAANPSSTVASLGLAAGNTGLSVAAKRLYFSMHLGFVDVATTSFFVGFTDIPSNNFAGNNTDAWGFFKAAAATTLSPFSISNTATAFTAFAALTGSTATTITNAADTINLHIQGEYLVGTSIAYWADTSIAAEGGGTTAAKPTLVGYTNLSTKLPKAADKTNFAYGLKTTSGAAKTINISQIFIGIEY